MLSGQNVRPQQHFPGVSVRVYARQTQGTAQMKMPQLVLPYAVQARILPLLEQKENGGGNRPWTGEPAGHFFRRKRLRRFIGAAEKPPFGMGPHAVMGYDFLGVHSPF